jgi:toxin ParE1/3/4
VSEVRYSRRAREDLLDIWLYVARQPSEVAADRILDRIEDACRTLARHPELGPARPEIADGARSLIVQRWLALYRLTTDGVQIVRIIDGARDLKRLEWTSDWRNPCVGDALEPWQRRRARRGPASRADRKTRAHLGAALADGGMLPL